MEQLTVIYVQVKCLIIDLNDSWHSAGLPSRSNMALNWSTKFISDRKLSPHTKLSSVYLRTICPRRRARLQTYQMGAVVQLHWSFTQNYPNTPRQHTLRYCCQHFLLFPFRQCTAFKGKAWPCFGSKDHTLTAILYWLSVYSLYNVCILYTQTKIIIAKAEKK